MSASWKAVAPSTENVETVGLFRSKSAHVSHGSDVPLKNSLLNDANFEIVGTDAAVTAVAPNAIERSCGAKGNSAMVAREASSKSATASTWKVSNWER